MSDRAAFALTGSMLTVGGTIVLAASIATETFRPGSSGLAIVWGLVLSAMGIVCVVLQANKRTKSKGD